MKITQTGVSHAPTVTNLSPQKLRRNLTTVFNEFIGIPLRSPLTIQTLDAMQEKFWSASQEVKNKFADKVWHCWEEIAKELANKSPIKKELSFHKDPKRRPVVFNTNEGLDVDLELKSNGKKLETVSASVSPGGCSVNVSRALNNFGTDAILTGTVGLGTRGMLLTKLLEKEGIHTNELVYGHNDSRYFNCTFVDGKEYWVVSDTPWFEHYSFLEDRLFNICKWEEGEVLALAVKGPKGVPDDYLQKISKEAATRYNMIVIYDTKVQEVGKDYFMSILESGPYMVKPNLVEFAALVGKEENKLREDRDSLCHSAIELINKYKLGLIMISMDKDGALFTDGKRFAVAKPPKIQVACTVGAGDTGIAGFISRGKERGYDFRALKDNEFQDVLKAFVAAGAATCTKVGTELAQKEDFEKMENGVSVKLI